MLATSLTATAGTTTHRFTTSKPHWAHGHRERSLCEAGDYVNLKGCEPQSGEPARLRFT
jgi:hypothetical protein